MNFDDCYEYDWLNDFLEPTGVLFDVDGMSPCYIFFRLLGGHNTLTLIRDETNRYAEQFIDRTGRDKLKKHLLQIIGNL